MEGFSYNEKECVFEYIERLRDSFIPSGFKQVGTGERLNLAEFLSVAAAAAAAVTTAAAAA